MYRIKNHMQYTEFFGIDGILSDGHMMFTEEFINKKKVRFSKQLKTPLGFSVSTPSAASVMPSWLK